MACRVGSQQFHSWIASLLYYSFSYFYCDPYSLFNLIYFYVNKRKDIETSLPDPVPIATYVRQYLAVAKAAAWRGSGHTRIFAYTQKYIRRYLPKIIIIPYLINMVASHKYKMHSERHNLSGWNVN